MAWLAAISMALFLAGHAPAAAGSPRADMVVDTAWLAARLGDPDIVILQVGDPAAYDGGHIPGAGLLSLAEISAPPTGPDPLFLEMPEPGALRARLEALGVSDTSTVIIYPTRDIQSATRAVFVLDAAGLGARTRLLEGGLPAWKAEGRPLSTQPAAARPGRLSPLTFRPLVVDADYVKRHARAPGYVVVDARAPEFHSGRKAGGLPGKPHRAGRIAGARSVPFSTVTTPALKLAPEAEIAARFEAAGVKPGDKVIAYCHVGQQASATLFAARSLGLDVLLYDGSFEEWSRLGGEIEAGDEIEAGK
ncbi:rhodanese-like domain-containing protein [Phenylobacterium sp.]|uniref:sulfurtransferase n=1 Tax=Phenylobacterium sp. TaxID=1871053 RepID=UPI00301D5C18